jgi:two-component system chemotaxis sensor kinase CheA
VRVHTEVIDRFLGTVGEVIITSGQLRTAAKGDAGGPAGLAVGLDRMDRMVGELQRRALELRTTRLLRILEPLPRLARELAEHLDKRVEVEIRGAEIELDRSILDRLSDPLVHLLRNAVDHGVETPAERVAAGKSETGLIIVDAVRVRDSIRISVIDDGRGVDLDAVRSRAVEAGAVIADLAEDLPPEEIAALVFRPGLTTANSVSEISGRGVGMDAVRVTIESLGGSVEIATEPGRGTATTLLVPITAAIQRVLLVAIGGETVAIPVARIERVIEASPDEIERSARDAFVLVEDAPMAVIGLAERLGLPAPAADAHATLLLADIRGECMAFQVDRVVGQQQIYVKPVPDLLSGVRSLAGFTVLGDGQPVFLLDLNQIT